MAPKFYMSIEYPECTYLLVLVHLCPSSRELSIYALFVTAVFTLLLMDGLAFDMCCFITEFAIHLHIDQIIVFATIFKLTL